MTNLIKCPHCGSYFSYEMADESGWAVCPFCEKEVEVEEDG